MDIKKEIVEKGKYYYAYSHGGTASNGKWDRAYYLASNMKDIEAWAKKNGITIKDQNVYYLWYIGSSNSTTASTKGKTVNVNFNSNAKPFDLTHSKDSSGNYAYATLGGEQYLYYHSKCYKVKTTTTKYYFRRLSTWSSWSSWTDNNLGYGNNNELQQIERRVKYYAVGKEPN